MSRWVLVSIAGLAVAAIPLAALMAQGGAQASFVHVETGRVYGDLQAAVDAVGDGEGTVLLQVDSYDLLLLSTHDEGRILMWADEWISYDSEWTSRPELHVEQFWLNEIMWLTPVAECQVPIPIIQ